MSKKKNGQKQKSFYEKEKDKAFSLKSLKKHGPVGLFVYSLLIGFGFLFCVTLFLSAMQSTLSFSNLGVQKEYQKASGRTSYNYGRLPKLSAEETDSVWFTHTDKDGLFLVWYSVKEKRVRASQELTVLKTFSEKKSSLLAGRQLLEFLKKKGELKNRIEKLEYKPDSDRWVVNDKAYAIEFEDWRVTAVNNEPVNEGFGVLLSSAGAESVLKQNGLKKEQLLLGSIDKDSDGTIVLGYRNTALDKPAFIKLLPSQTVELVHYTPRLELPQPLIKTEVD